MSLVSSVEMQDSGLLRLMEDLEQQLRQVGNNSSGNGGGAKSSTTDPRSRTPAGPPPAKDSLAASLERIQNCVSVNDFVSMYNADEYQTACANLLQECGTRDTEDWAREWAIHMQNPPKKM